MFRLNFSYSGFGIKETSFSNINDDQDKATESPYTSHPEASSHNNDQGPGHNSGDTITGASKGSSSSSSKVDFHGYSNENTNGWPKDPNDFKQQREDKPENGQIESNNDGSNNNNENKDSSNVNQIHDPVETSTVSDPNQPNKMSGSHVTTTTPPGNGQNSPSTIEDIVIATSYSPPSISSSPPSSSFGKNEDQRAGQSLWSNAG